MMMSEPKPVEATPPEIPSRGGPWRTGALAALLLVCWSGLLIYGLHRQGVVNLDEPVYVFSALTDHQIVSWILGGKKGDIIARLKKSPYPVENEVWAKPLWHVAAVAATFIFGPHPDALVWINVWFGLVAVLFFILLAGRFLGWRPAPMGLAVTLFLLSPVFLYFCRVRLAHALVWALFLPALWLYLDSLDRTARGRMLGCGLLLGATFTAHGSVLPFIGLWVVFEVLRPVWGRTPWRTGLTRLGLLIVGLIVPLLVCQGLTWGFIKLSGERLQAWRNGQSFRTRQFFNLPGATCSNLDYLDQLRFNFSNFSRPVKKSTLPDRGLAAARWLVTADGYLYRPWVYEGSLRSLLLLVGLMIAGWWVVRRRWARRPRSEGADDPAEADEFLWWLTVGALAFYWLTPAHGGSVRPLLLCWPLAALLAAKVWGGRLERLGRRWATVLVTGLVVLSLVNLIPLYSVRSGFGQAADFVRARGQSRVAFLFLGSAGMGQLRAVGIRYDLARTPAELAVVRGPRYLIISRRDSFFNPPPKTAAWRLADEIRARLKPVFQTDFRPLAQAYDFYRRGRHDLIDRVTTWLVGRSVKRRPLLVRVYRLAEAQALMASGGGRCPGRPVWESWL
jgi:hypothetical protein